MNAPSHLEAQSQRIVDDIELESRRVAQYNPVYIEAIAIACIYTVALINAGVILLGG